MGLANCAIDEGTIVDFQNLFGNERNCLSLEFQMDTGKIQQHLAVYIYIYTCPRLKFTTLKILHVSDLLFK